MVTHSTGDWVRCLAQEHRSHLLPVLRIEPTTFGLPVWHRVNTGRDRAFAVYTERDKSTVARHLDYEINPGIRLLSGICGVASSVNNHWLVGIVFWRVASLASSVDTINDYNGFYCPV